MTIGNSDGDDMTIPNPGSDEAIDKGCSCPVLDNAHGRGDAIYGREGAFWVSADCPLHAEHKSEVMQ